LAGAAHPGVCGEAGRGRQGACGAEEAFEPVEKALRLDPLGRGREFSEWFMCEAHAHLAQWEKAIRWCQRSATSNPALFYINLSAANAWLEHTAEATAAVAELRKLKPGFTVQAYNSMLPLDNAKWQSENQRIVDGLKKAGVPEF
jgi:hypothetical protein